MMPWVNSMFEIIVLTAQAATYLRFADPSVAEDHELHVGYGVPSSFQISEVSAKRVEAIGPCLV